VWWTTELCAHRHEVFLKGLSRTISHHHQRPVFVVLVVCAFLAIQMALVLVRHGERTDYAQPTWVAQQKQTTDGRPWDPPLTARGRLQAVAAGERLVRECAELGVPQPSQVYCSPFTRCVETAVGIARATGVPTVNVEPSLSEDMGEKWCVLLSSQRSGASPGVR
jgi:hypothetical protein